ncbi:ABC-type transport system, involved in lipoprotein release, permease component [Aequorivita sublithincola DSM 14238]|uniref:ABC-type transport system, involved in lipoprotein release, permease component n=1 Tax=Aequorivita sublithincola (strain DSM 14238 / LMG 21431 / ACAM 643 / 9-3) TaxID=746697 RepID=I3YUT5_AEQSU|nr:FtsX-like permease family protein [Aequorivita sublithincola]AFL80753.1 ABC-type transport system, involved in lipoprotein release, permease component [Aequorivita sublithincola DSM 14238]
MNFSLYIAKRYLFSKSSNNAINIITGIAAAGVVVGAMSLFIVLSGFSGLKDFSLQFTNEFDSDLKIIPESGKIITFSEAQRTQLKNSEGIENFSEIIEERIFLHYKGKNQIAYIKGVDSLYGKVTQLDSIMYVGEWLVPNEHQVVTGLSTNAKLSLGMNDYADLLEIYVPKPGTGQLNALDPSDAFNKENVIVSGVYQVNEDLDAKYVFSDIAFARNLLSLDSTKVSSIEMKLLPNTSEEKVRSEINKIFPSGIIIKNRIQQNDALYKMLNTENIAVYLIFTLVLIIALFNVIGSIIMMILDKRKNIKTLYNMGASLKEIRRIFFLQGTLMSVLGGLLGIILGILAVLAQLKYEFVAITSTLPYPVKLKLINIVIVFVTISVLGIIASKIASSRVREKLLN